MQPSVILKYDFRIRTRGGALVENVSIHGRDADDAERKLRQMEQKQQPRVERHFKN